jgi:hypothetical protein
VELTEVAGQEMDVVSNLMIVFLNFPGLSGVDLGLFGVAMVVVWDRCLQLCGEPSIHPVCDVIPRFRPIRSKI